MDWKNY